MEFKLGVKTAKTAKAFKNSVETSGMTNSP
jgi:hypothetical protein